MVLGVPIPWNNIGASQKTKELGLEVLGKDGAGISGVKGHKEQENLWSGLSLSAATMKLTAEGQGQNDSTLTGPGSTQPSLGQGCWRGPRQAPSQGLFPGTSRWHHPTATGFSNGRPETRREAGQRAGQSPHLGSTGT